MTKNLVKYTAAIFLSLIGSEILKLSTSFYIYKQTGNFWTVTLFYLMTQIPNLITYLLSGKFIKFNAKQCLVWSDVMSVVLLLILLMVFLVKNKSILSILILIINSLIALVHAFRFIHLKNIIYFISDNFTNIKKYNWSNTWATSIALTTFPLLLLSLKNVDFWCLILLNIFTYITSGFLYLTLKTNLYIFKISELDHHHKLTNQNKVWAKIFTIAFSVLIGFALYPKQSGLVHFFKFVEKEVNIWGAWLSFGTAVFGVMGVLINFLLQKKYKDNKKMFVVIVCLFSFVGLSWNLVKLLTNNTDVLVFSYIMIISSQQLLFSLMLPLFYNYNFLLFDQKNNIQITGVMLFARVIFSAALTLLLTFLITYFNFPITYLTYTLFNLAFVLIVVTSIFLVFQNVNKNIGS